MIWRLFSVKKTTMTFNLPSSSLTFFGSADFSITLGCFLGNRRGPFGVHGADGRTSIGCSRDIHGHCGAHSAPNRAAFLAASYTHTGRNVHGCTQSVAAEIGYRIPAFIYGDRWVVAGRADYRGAISARCEDSAFWRNRAPDDFGATLHDANFALLFQIALGARLAGKSTDSSYGADSNAVWLSCRRGRHDSAGAGTDDGVFCIDNQLAHAQYHPGHFAYFLVCNFHGYFLVLGDRVVRRIGGAPAVS